MERQKYTLKKCCLHYIIISKSSTIIMNCNTGSLLQYAEEKIYIITNVYVPVTTSTEDRIRRLIETQKTEFKIAAIVNILYSSFR